MICFDSPTLPYPILTFKFMDDGPCLVGWKLLQARPVQLWAKYFGLNSNYRPKSQAQAQAHPNCKINIGLCAKM